MKKLLGSTLALAMLVPAGANAELLKNFKASGSLEVDAVSANNITDLNTSKYDQINTVQTRVMVHADWDVLDDVHARISLDKNDRTYGNAANATPANGSQNLQDVQNNVVVDESYVKIDKLFGALDTTLGRQYYGEQNDMVIYFGPKYQQYTMPITALDGARFDWNSEKIGVTVLAAQQKGGALSVADTGNKSIRGIDVHVKPTDNISGSVYLYDRETVNDGSGALNVAANDHLYVAGLRAKVTMGGAWAKAEFDQDFGANRTVPGTGGNVYGNVGAYTGSAAKLNIGAKLDLNNLGALTGWAEGAFGTGGQTANRNFTAIASDYRPGGIAGRFGGVTAGAVGALDNGLNNRVVLGAGVKATPAALSKLTAGLSFWQYRAQNATSLTINTPGKTGGNKFLGNEYDLDLSWAHSENVLISAGVGTFQPGRTLIVNTGTAVNPATLSYTDFSIKF